MKKKILIIEDDEGIADILEFIAHDLGCDAVTSTYTLPVGTIQELSPAVILLDHWLVTGELGGDLCLKLKSCDTTTHIPVVLISAHPDLQKIAEQSCANDYITKPFEFKDVEERIIKYLS